MRTLLRKLGLTLVALFAIIQAYAIREVRTGESVSLSQVIGIYGEDFYSLLNGDYSVNSSADSLAVVENDTIIKITAPHYNGQGTYQKYDVVISLNLGDTILGDTLRILPDVMLTDGQPYTNKDLLSNVRVKYTRSFAESTVGNWQAVYLPFSIDIARYSNDFEIAKMYGNTDDKDMNKDGVIDSLDASYVIFEKVSSGVTVPNRPYLFQPKHAGNIDFVSCNNTLYPADLSPIKFTTPSRVYAFSGVYENKVIVANDYNLYFSSGKLNYRTTGSTTLKSFRWFVNTSSNDSVVFEPKDHGMKLAIVDVDFWKIPESEIPCDTIHAHVGDKPHLLKYSAKFPITFIESSDSSVAIADKDSVYIKAGYYNGEGEYEPKMAKITVYNEYGAVAYVYVVMESEAVLVDGKPYTNKETLHMPAKYTRSFAESTVGNWQAVYLPFSIDIAKYSNDFEIAELYGNTDDKDMNGDGVIDDLDAAYIIFTKVASGVTEPNRPYLIRIKQAGDIDFVSYDSMLYGADLTPREYATSSRIYSFNGVYENKLIVANDYNLYFSSGKLNYRTTGSTTLKSYRWFVNTTTNDGIDFEPKDHGMKLAIVDVDFWKPQSSPVITTIEIVESDNEGVNTDIKGIYTINGVKIESLDNVPSGVYIKNGKKVLINKNK